MCCQGAVGLSSNPSFSAFSLSDLVQVIYASVSSTIIESGNIAYFIMS